MTTYDYYRVTLPEFLRHIAVERFTLEKHGFNADDASIFSIVLTEIHYLTLHMNYLRSIRFSNRVDLSIDKDVAVQDKLRKKTIKLRRYVKWRKSRR